MLFLLLSNEQRKTQSCLRKQQKELCLNPDVQSAPKYLHIYTFSAIPDQQLTQRNLRKLLPVLQWALAKSAPADLCAPKADDSRRKPCITLPLQANGDLSAGSGFLSLQVLYLDVFARFARKLKFRHRVLVAVVMGAAIQHIISDKSEAAIMQNNKPLSLCVPLWWPQKDT